MTPRRTGSVRYLTCPGLAGSPTPETSPSSVCWTGWRWSWWRWPGSWWSGHGEGEELTALLAVAVAELLVSPISWGHHWVWIAPALLLFTSPAWWRRKMLLAVGLPVLVVFAIGPPWLLPSDNKLELHWAWCQHLIGDSYVLIGVLFLVLAAFLTPRWPASASGGTGKFLTSAVPQH